MVEGVRNEFIKTTAVNMTVAKSLSTTSRYCACSRGCYSDDVTCEYACTTAAASARKAKRILSKPKLIAIQNV